MAKINVMAYTSKNPEKQAIFRAMMEESDVLRGRVELVMPANDEEALKALPEAEVLLCYRFPPEWLEHARNLRWMHVGWAGIDHVLTPELARSKIRITNARGIHAEVQSDYIIGMMIMWSRKLLWAERFRRDKRWLEWRKPMVLQGFPLRNRVLLIIGVGAIGSAVARKAMAFQMQVYGVKRKVEPEDQSPYFSKLVTPDHLEELVGQADFVVPLVPLTSETRGFFDWEFFSRMKPSAFFINTSRGKAVDEPALVRALQEQRIAGAALDVFDTEPLPEDSPLWEMENVILTPHIGGNYPEYTMDVYEQFIPNLERYVRGDPLLNEANKQLGY